MRRLALQSKLVIQVTPSKLVPQLAVKRVADGKDSAGADSDARPRTSQGVCMCVCVCVHVCVVGALGTYYYDCEALDILALVSL